MMRWIQRNVRAVALRFQGDATGASGTEYAVILALIVTVVVVCVGTLGQNVSGTTKSISHDLGAESGMTVVLTTYATTRG